jgi:hypothetical protein
MFHSAIRVDTRGDIFATGTFTFALVLVSYLLMLGPTRRLLPALFAIGSDCVHTNKTAQFYCFCTAFISAFSLSVYQYGNASHFAADADHGYTNADAYRGANRGGSGRFGPIYRLAHTSKSGERWRANGG